jgi:hypothetical protein
MIAGRATSFAAASASGPQVGPRPFADQVPLELGQGCKHLEDQATRRGARLDALRE